VTPDLVVRGRQVLTPSGLRAAAVVVADGTIVDVMPFEDAPSASRTIDAGESVVFPGLVDSHVHVNEPGRTDWEGFETATRAAAAGGVTTIVDMPLNCLPPTTTVAALEEKRAVAAAKAHVDVGFWGGAVPGNAGELAGLHQAGVLGFKCFLVDSGVEEFPPLETRELQDVMRRLAALGALLIVHAEAPGPIAQAQEHTGSLDPRRYGTYLDTRPATAEVEAIEEVVGLAEQTGCRVHVLHLSAAAALGVLADARARGVPVTAETCPHYLTLSADEIADGATACKCAPPIRDAGNQDRLWEALDAGLIDAVVSDHSPCPPDLKLPEEGDYLRAWGGISSLQLGLPVVWTAARERGRTLKDLARWMSAGPARIAGLPGKGAIAPGHDADLVVWDPDAERTVDPAALEHRHPVTPYAGRLLAGVVEATYLGGVEIYRQGEVLGANTGRLLNSQALPGVPAASTPPSAGVVHGRHNQGSRRSK
jgi:allantoinase